MTLQHMLSQMGIGTNHMSDRYVEYSPAQEHVYYTYEPPEQTHTEVATSKYHGGSGLKSNASMSALTLLAFLFFLHILQQCLKDHMTSMTNTPVMIMTTKRDGQQDVLRNTEFDSKVDKTGVSAQKKPNIQIRDETKDLNINANYFETNDNINSVLTKVTTAEHKPKMDSEKVKNVYANF